MGTKLYVDKETGELQTPYLDEAGHEVLSSTPVAPPIGYVKQPSLYEQMRAMVRQELSAAAEAAGAETFEEADDFDVGDFDPTSPYEEVFDPTPVSELRRRASAAEAPDPGEPGASRRADAAAPPSDGPGSREALTPSPEAAAERPQS